MLNSMNVTSADLQVVLKVEDLFDDGNGVTLEGFSVDSAVASDNVEMAEARRGVDGHIVAGVVKNVYPVTITLEANSPSLVSLEMLRDAMQSTNKPYECTLTVHFPSQEKTVTYVHGVLTNASILTNAQRTLQPTQWGFVFESVEVN